jgi:hypothetical protein
MYRTKNKGKFIYILKNIAYGKTIVERKICKNKVRKKETYSNALRRIYF